MQCIVKKIEKFLNKNNKKKYLETEQYKSMLFSQNNTFIGAITVY